MLMLPVIIWMMLIIMIVGYRGVKAELVSPNAENSHAVMDLGGCGGVALGSTVGLLSLFFHALVDFNFHITANMITAAVLTGVIMGYNTIDR